MALPVLLALVFLLFSLTAGAVYVFLHARRFLREMKSVSATVDGPVRELERSVDRLNASMAAAETNQPRLEAAVTQLRRSVARLNVLSSALQDSRESLAWLTAVYPRK